ncbi:MAG TPA: glycosyltransferase family 9 protein [Vicinamibacterales bacterium]|nr:glycosyltransferase family 9 protein [Vicinamibacterales bacterium]
MPGLQILGRRERALVAAADALLRPLAWFRGRPAAGPVRRILLLRLERIGDLLMTLDAIALVRSTWPDAQVDLAVGSWNADLARLIPGLNTVHTLDVPWLAREGSGQSWPELTRRARAWKTHRYDLVVNFEPDIRSNILAWLSGARRRAGYWTGGGGALLTEPAAFDPAGHVGMNAERLVHLAAGRSEWPPAAPLRAGPRVQVPESARTRARALTAGLRRPFIGVHVSGGRESKQWHLDRFAAVARQLAHDRDASIVLTGSTADRPMVAKVSGQLGGIRVVNTAGSLEVVELAALIETLDVFVTSDTGPMHLASAVGTPVVALFGPADPRRYGPRAANERILRVDLPCSPCGQVRLPPLRCRGHVPDCMDGIGVAAVVAAASELIDRLPQPMRTGAR